MSGYSRQGVPNNGLLAEIEVQSIDDAIQLIQIGEQPGNKLTAVCSSGLAEKPWEFDQGPPGYGPGASMTDAIPSGSSSTGCFASGVSPGLEGGT